MSKPLSLNQIERLTKTDTDFANNVEQGRKNREDRKYHFQIAVRVLQYLKDHGKSKVWLAEQMDVSPQRIGVLLKGKGNMTLSTVEQLERATGLSLVVIPSSQPEEVATRSAFSFQGAIAVTSEYVAANFINPALHTP